MLREAKSFGAENKEIILNQAPLSLIRSSYINNVLVIAISKY